MHKWFAIFALLAIMLLPARANAQSAVSLDQVDIAVWPEYDTADVLVIYKIALSPQTPLPAEITLRLPASVQKTAVVAVGTSAEAVSDKDVVSSVVPGADFTRVTIKANGQFIQVEYYDSNLTKTGNERQYAFDWLGDFAVKQFRFGLREPLKSSNVKVDPALPAAGTDTEGFRFGEFTQADVKEGQKLSFAISYQRDTDSPSTSFLQVQSSTEEYGELATPVFDHPSKGGELAPIDILDYIYAVLHSPTYRDKYKEFLKIDFPRVPYPKDAATFWQLVALGSELRQIHLLESPVVSKLITQYPVGGSNIVGKIRYDVSESNVYINETQYFANVPKVAWEFYIGGYQPAQKWLKDRKERELLFDDILHYQKIIIALTETDRLMNEIDKIEIE